MQTYEHSCKQRPDCLCKLPWMLLKNITSNNKVWNIHVILTLCTYRWFHKKGNKQRNCIWMLQPSSSEPPCCSVWLYKATSWNSSSTTQLSTAVVILTTATWWQFQHRGLVHKLQSPPNHQNLPFFPPIEHRSDVKCLDQEVNSSFIFPIGIS